MKIFTYFVVSFLCFLSTIPLLAMDNLVNLYSCQNHPNAFKEIPFIELSLNGKSLGNLKKHLENNFSDYLPYVFFDFETNKAQFNLTLPMINLLTKGYGILNVFSSISTLKLSQKGTLSANPISIFHTKEFESCFNTLLEKSQFNNNFTEPQVLDWSNENISSFQSTRALLDYIFKLNGYNGFHVGEEHNDSLPRLWLIRNFKSLVEDYKVTILYLEGYPHQLQSLLDQYMNSSSDDFPQPLVHFSDLFLQALYKSSEPPEAYSYLKVVAAAKKAGIKSVIAIDDAYYMSFPNCNSDPKSIEQRLILMNQVFAKKYQTKAKSVTLCGGRHLKKYIYNELYKGSCYKSSVIQGLGEISGLPTILCVSRECSILSGKNSYTPGIYFTADNEADVVRGLNKEISYETKSEPCDFLIYNFLD